MSLDGKYLDFDSRITEEIFNLIIKLLVSTYGESDRNLDFLKPTFENYKDNKRCIVTKCKYFNWSLDNIGQGQNKATVQEILGYDPFIKEEFVLPRNWVCKMTNESKNTLNNYRKNILKYDDYDCTWDYMLPNGSGGSLKDGIEITFDQFKKYVLKSNNEITKEKVIDINEIRAFAIKLNNEGKSDKIREALKYFKSESITKLNKEDYSEFYKMLNSIDDKPKQTLKQAVHCKTQEEWNFMLSKIKQHLLNTKHWPIYTNRTCWTLFDNCCTTLQYCSEQDGYQILSFQEWCDLNEYKMENEIKSNQEFKIGDWVIVTNKILESDWSNKQKSIGYIFKISNTNALKSFNDGYPESTIDDCNKFKINYQKEWIRHATQEEINNHLISIRQIPAENNSATSNYGNNFSSSSGIGLESKEKYKYFKEFNPDTNQLERGKTQSLSKMILSIDDEELPMVNIIKTKTVNLLNLE